jgi:hypothetical protein
MDAKFVSIIRPDERNMSTANSSCGSSREVIAPTAAAECPSLNAASPEAIGSLGSNSVTTAFMTNAADRLTTSCIKIACDHGTNVSKSAQRQMSQRLRRWLTYPILFLLSFALTAVASAQASNLGTISGQVMTTYGTPAQNVPVRVCAITAIGVPCSTAGVTLYSDANLTHAISNPISTDQYGNYAAFTVNGVYLVQVTPQVGLTYAYYDATGAGSGGGSGCQTISNGGDCVSNDPSVSQDIAQPTNTEFSVDFPDANGQENQFNLNQFNEETFDAEFNDVLLYSNFQPMDIESAAGGFLGAFDNLPVQFSWDASGNVLSGAGRPSIAVNFEDPYPGWNIPHPGTLQTAAAEGLVIESNSPVQEGMAISASTGHSYTLFPDYVTTQAIVIQGTLGLSQSVIGTYGTGWSQSATATAGELDSVGYTGNINNVCGADPCTYVAPDFTWSATPVSFSDCNINVACTGVSPSTDGTPKINYQHAYTMLTISGSSCASGAFNGTWAAYELYSTPTAPTVPQSALSIWGTSITATCPSDRPTFTWTPVLGAYGEQVQFIDATNGGFNTLMLPASAPVSSQITGSLGAKLPIGYTPSLQMWVGRTDGTGNTITITPWPGDTINGSAGAYTLSVPQYGVVHFLSDGIHNWYAEGGGGGSGLTGLMGDCLAGDDSSACTVRMVHALNGAKTLTIDSANSAGTPLALYYNDTATDIAYSTYEDPTIGQQPSGPPWLPTPAPVFELDNLNTGFGGFLLEHSKIFPNLGLNFLDDNPDANPISGTIGGSFWFEDATFLDSQTTGTQHYIGLLTATGNEDDNVEIIAGGETNGQTNFGEQRTAQLQFPREVNITGLFASGSFSVDHINISGGDVPCTSNTLDFSVSATLKKIPACTINTIIPPFDADDVFLNSSAIVYMYADGAFTTTNAGNIVSAPLTAVPGQLYMALYYGGTGGYFHTSPGVWRIYPVGGTGSSVTWPTSTDLVISNGTNSPAGLAEVDSDCVVGSGGAWVAGPCSGTGSGTNVSVNGGGTLATANLNGTTPTAGTNGINVTWQVSSTNVSAEIVGDGNAAHFLNGTGAFSTPSGGMVYPGAGIANSTGSAWGTSYTVGNSGTDIPQLSSGLLNASILPLATTGAFGAVKPDGTTITISAGVISAVGGGSGLPCSGTCTAGVLPLFGSGGTSITNSLLDYGVTTASTFTFGAGVDINSTSDPSQIGLTYNTGHAPTVGGATTATYAVNSSGQAIVADGSGAYSRPCTVANFSSICSGGGGSGAGLITYSGPSLSLSGTQYFPIGGGGAASATEANVDLDSPAAATIQNFSVQMSAAPGAGNSVAYTWRKNASSTTLTCTISGASATSCSDTTHSFTVAAADLMTIQAVTTGTIVGTPTVVMGTQFGIAVSAGVTSFTGDGTVLSNSASTGAVTATLTSAGSHTVLANLTGSSASPTYTATQGTDSSLLTSGTVSGTAATLCTDANGGATTVGCTSGGSSGPTFKGAVYTPATSSSTTAATTPSLAGVSSSDLLIVFCRSLFGNTVTITSSPSETWNTLSSVGSNPTATVQMAWAIAGSAASHTVTCTQSGTGTFQSAMLLDYSGTGTSLNTSVNNSGTSSGVQFPFNAGTGGTYSAATTASTSQRTLIVFCNAVGDLKPYYAGYIDGIHANLRVVDGPGTGTGSTTSSSACEDIVTTTAVNPLTANFGFNSNSGFANTLAAFNY